jgi:hypothetical protein
MYWYPTTPSKILASVLFAALASAVAMGAATTIPIPGLCNTGVVGPCNGGTGASLQAVGSADLNWELSLPAPTAPSSQPPTAVPAAATFGPNSAWVSASASNGWLANGPNSAWITPKIDNAVGGYYFYQATFTIPTGYDPSTAVISGMFTSDNEGIAIFVNGNAVPFGVVFPGPGDSSLPFTGSFTLSAVTAPFINGANTLVFEIRNRGELGFDSNDTPTGLRVEFNSQLSTVGPAQAQTGQPVYTQDSNLSDFTSCSGQNVQYATFIGGTYLNLTLGGAAGGPTTLSPTQTYIPTTAILAGPTYYPRVLGTDPPVNPVVVQFIKPVSQILVFDSIDHPTSNWDAYQYQIWGGNYASGSSTVVVYTPLFDPTGVSAGPPFTLTNWTGIGPTLVNNTLTPPGNACSSGTCQYTTGYEAYFDFTSSGSYQFYAFRPSAFTLNPATGGENEAELTAVAEAVPCSFLEVCKSSSSVNPVTGNFTFTSPAFTSAPNNSITVPVGSCSGPIPVIPGTVTINETPAPGVGLSSVVASGYDPVTFQQEDRLVSCTPPAGSAVVTAVAGGVSSETIATFTNQGTTGQSTIGQLKICKIAGAGVAVGTNFNFTATSTSSAISQTYTVPAGPASEGGYCVLDSTTFPAGTTVRVAEVLSISNLYTVTSAASSSFLVGTTGGSSIVATLGTGITEVTFTNSVTTIHPFLGDFNGGLSFSATPSAAPATQVLTLTSTPPVPFTAVATETSGPPGWLTVTPAQSTTPAAVTVSVAALPAGAYNGAIAIASTDPANPLSSTIPVTFVVAANAGFNAVGSMAQLAFAGGWATIFSLVNTGTEPVQATLNFFDNNGNPLPVPLEFPQSSTTAGQPVTTTTVTVNPGAGQVIQTAGLASQTTQVGWTQLLANGSLSGFAVFQQTNGSRIQEAVVPLENRTPAGFVLWFDNTGGNATGIAVANASAQAASVPVVIRDDSGAILQSTTIQIAADGHTSFDLASTYASTANIRGTLEIDVPTGGLLSVLGIEFSPLDAFSTIPALTK